MGIGVSKTPSHSVAGANRRLPFFMNVLFRSAMCCYVPFAMRAIGTLLLLPVLFLCACAQTPTSQEFQREAEIYIRSSITELSPEPAVLGGTFYVLEIEWVDEDTARVVYEDGHIQLQGTTDVSMDASGAISATQIQLEQE